MGKEKSKDESVYSLAPSDSNLEKFAVWVGESIVKEEWQRYVFIARTTTTPSADLFEVTFPDGRKKACSFDRGTELKIGDGLTFFDTSVGVVETEQIRYLMKRSKKRSPPPTPADALDDESDGSLE